MREQSPTSRLRKAGFSDPLRASRLLAEPASAQLGGLDPEDFAPVADPDQCLLALIRLAEACADSTGLESCLRGPGRRGLLAALGISRLLGDFVVSPPGALDVFERRERP